MYKKHETHADSDSLLSIIFSTKYLHEDRWSVMVLMNMEITYVYAYKGHLESKLA